MTRPHQTSSSRPQSGVTELMSFQYSCATTTDASFSFIVWPALFQIIPVISPIISVIIQIIPVIILFFPVIIFEVRYVGKALNPNRSLDFSRIACNCRADFFCVFRRRSGLRQGKGRRKMRGKGMQGGEELDIDIPIRSNDL